MIRGLGRGRALGFPTANLAPPPPDKLLPAEGIYTACATLASERIDGLLHLGPRPTFAGSPPAIELFLIDFERDIYGESVIVDVLHRLRAVRSFPSGDDLVEQMRRDLADGRDYFRRRRG